MWYCEIEFVSKNKKNIVFTDEKEASEFYEKFKTNSFTHGLLEVNNNDKPMLININNVEIISKPTVYKKE